MIVTKYGVFGKMRFNMKDSVEHILKNHPERFRQLSSLLGLIYICKVTECKDLEALVNLYGVPAKYWIVRLNEVIDDDDFGELLSGELFEWFVILSLWETDHEYTGLDGTVEYFMKMLEDYEKKKRQGD